MTDPVSKRILVVDDDSSNRKLLETLLAADGYVVECCDSGAAALEAIAVRVPDAILLDIMMPRMDGFEVVRQLKANPAWQAIPLIMITALDDEASRMRLAGAGIVDVLTKPVDRWQLKASLAAILTRTGDRHA